MPPDEAPIAQSADAPSPHPQAPPPVVPPAAESGASVDSATETPPPAPLKAAEHAQLARARIRMAQQRKDAIARTEKAEADAKAAIARADAAEAASKAAAKELADAEAAPVEWAAKRGKTPETTIRDFVDKTAPEKQIAELARKLEESEARAAEREKAAAKLVADREAQATQQAEGAAVMAFASEVVREEKRFPYLNIELSKEQIANEARLIQQAAKREGKSYSFEQVATFLESQAKILHTRKEARRNALLTPSQEGETASATGQKNGQNRAASSEKSTPGTATRAAPTNGSRRLTRDEEEAADLAALRKAMAADSAARNPKPNGASKA